MSNPSKRFRLLAVLSGAATLAAAGCGAAEDSSNGLGGAAGGAEKRSMDAAPGDSRGGGGSGGSSGAGSAGVGGAGAGGMGAGADSGSAGSTTDSDAGSGNSLDGATHADSADLDASDGGESECAGGQVFKASNETSMRASGYGQVGFTPSTQNQIVRLQTTMVVPPKPTVASGTVFLWPGLEPLQGDKNYQPIGLGVLQPVLTWGGTCAPNAPANSYADWWISAQYVNVYDSYMGHTGCLGGDGMTVSVGDELDIDMALVGTVWKQSVHDRQSGHAVTYDIDMLGQAQGWALFQIELPTSTKPSADLVFTSTTLTFASSEPAACEPNSRGTNDYYSAPQASTDGTRCCVSKITLRAQGVAATTMP